MSNPFSLESRNARVLPAISLLILNFLFYILYVSTEHVNTMVLWGEVAGEMTGVIMAFLFFTLYRMMSGLSK